MKKTAVTFCIVFFVFFQDSISAQNLQKLRRADCFFGVHFDLLASEDITDAGLTLTSEMVDTFLMKVRPDFIQIYCKGHLEISSYPTKVGYHVKGFEKDPLRLWRDVTEKNKVALSMHYSGVMDARAVLCAHEPSRKEGDLLRPVTFYDYASACNTYDEHSRFLVWFPL